MRNILTRSVIAAYLWVVDMTSLVRGTGNQVAWDLVTDGYGRGAFTVTLNGAVSVDDDELVVDALKYPLKKGTILDFGAKQFAQVTDDVAAEATSVPVEPLATAIADNATATAINNSDLTRLNPGSKFIPGGTIVGKWIADDENKGKIVPRALLVDGEKDTNWVVWGMIETDAISDSKVASLTGYSVVRSAHVYENMLPDADETTGLINSTYKAELIAAGGAWIFSTWRDSRGE